MEFQDVLNLEKRFVAGEFELDHLKSELKNANLAAELDAFDLHMLYRLAKTRTLQDHVLPIMPPISADIAQSLARSTLEYRRDELDATRRRLGLHP